MSTWKKHLNKNGAQITRPSFRWELILAGALIAMGIVLPYVIDDNYATGILIKCALYALLATSVNIVQGYCGLSYLGSAGLICVGAYTGAILMTKLSVNFFVAMLCSGLMAMVVGFLISLTTVRLSGAYLGIVTVGFSEIIRLIALNWTNVTGGSMGIKGIPVPTAFGVKLSGNWYFYIIVTLAALCLFITGRIIRSRIGRVWMSIKADQSATQALGVNIQAYKTLSFVIGVFWAGVGGCFMASYYRYISSDMFTMQESFNVLSMVIVGGMGTTIGPIAGAVLITAINEVFSFAAEWRQVGYAAVVIATLWWQPSGIAGLYQIIQRKIVARKGGKAHAAGN